MNHLIPTVQVSSKCLFSELHLKMYILWAKLGFRLFVLNISVWAQRNLMHSCSLKCYSFRPESDEYTNYCQCIAIYVKKNITSSTKRNYITFFMCNCFISVGRDSSVGIATHYGLDGLGIESRWGRDFSHPSIPALGPTQPLIQWLPGLSRG